MAILDEHCATVLLTAEQQGMLERYHALREASKRLNTRLFRMLPRSAITRSAKDLGMLVHDTIVFRTIGESDILAGYAMHDYRPSSTAPSLVERFASPAFDKEAAGLDEAEAAVRRYKATARFTIVQVRDVTPGFAIHVDDLLRGGSSLLLVDVWLSRTAVASAVFAGRIHQAEGFWMTTGGGVPLDADTLESVVHRLEGRYGERLARPDLLDPAQRSDLARRVLRICLDRRMTEHMSYQDPQEQGDL